MIERPTYEELLIENASLKHDVLVLQEKNAFLFEEYVSLIATTEYGDRGPTNQDFIDAQYRVNLELEWMSRKDQDNVIQPEGLFLTKAVIAPFAETRPLPPAGQD